MIALSCLGPNVIFPKHKKNKKNRRPIEFGFLLTYKKWKNLNAKKIERMKDLWSIYHHLSILDMGSMIIYNQKSNQSIYIQKNVCVLQNYVILCFFFFLNFYKFLANFSKQKKYASRCAFFVHPSVHKHNHFSI